MLTEYIEAAMRHAKYQILEDDGTFCGHIPELRGVIANADTLEECRDELRGVLEGWIALGLALREPIPPIDGVEIRVEVPA